MLEDHHYLVPLIKVYDSIPAFLPCWWVNHGYCGILIMGYIYRSILFIQLDLFFYFISNLWHHEAQFLVLFFSFFIFIAWNISWLRYNLNLFREKNPLNPHAKSFNLSLKKIIFERHTDDVTALRLKRDLCIVRHMEPLDMMGFVIYFCMKQIFLLQRE